MRGVGVVHHVFGSRFFHEGSWASPQCVQLIYLSSLIQPYAPAQAICSSNTLLATHVGSFQHLFNRLSLILSKYNFVIIIITRREPVALLTGWGLGELTLCPWLAQLCVLLMIVRPILDRSWPDWWFPNRSDVPRYPRYLTWQHVWVFNCMYFVILTMHPWLTRPNIIWNQYPNLIGNSAAHIAFCLRPKYSS